MSKFKVGDRVNIYSGPDIFIETISGIDPDGFLYFHPDDSDDMPVSPKQCRRLVKKKRREWWICLPGINTYKAEAFKTEYQAKLSSNVTEIVHVREVKSGKTN